MTALRHWLRRPPQPAKLRVDGRDVSIPSTAYKWAELAETIEGLGASRVEALGPNGEILRALSLESATPEADPVSAELAAERAREERADRAERDRVADAVAVARIVSDASRQAVELHAATYSRVLERYEALVSLTVQRLGVMERGYHSAMVALARAQGEAIVARAEQEAAQVAAQEEGGLGALGPVLAQVAAGMLGPGEPPPAAPPNNNNPNPPKK